VVGQEDEIHCSSRAVAQPKQDTTDGDGCEAETDPYSLQWAEPTPLASADEIHRRDAKDSEKTERNDNDTELTLGDHGAHIIAQPCEGATLGPEMRIGR
jgi:hypothetical protein